MIMIAARNVFSRSRPPAIGIVAVSGQAVDTRILDRQPQCVLHRRRLDTLVTCSPHAPIATRFDDIANRSSKRVAIAGTERFSATVETQPDHDLQSGRHIRFEMKGIVSGRRKLREV
ncbi:MAG: hypothetical protein KDJ37_17885 [Hyphomicrobiaceae bacterium]|nr:hypothetical protein [Hyphomicrobiaceae bacterium]